jgi:hypothetical protein
MAQASAGTPSKHLLRAKRSLGFIGDDMSHPFVGRYVICRCKSAGVHAGTLVSADGASVLLNDSRRLWRWVSNGGIALSGLSQHGLKASKSKTDTMVPEIALEGVIEIIPCSEAAARSIHAA